MSNEKLDGWAQEMLLIITGHVDGLTGGINDLGSSDGHYVEADVAFKVLRAFEQNSYYYVCSIGQEGDSPLFAYPKSNPKVGLVVSFDEDEPGMRQLSWYDEAKW